ncbi:unnamed protein product [Paramecium sonneborni]|uniref:ADP-ribosylation factor n=1 Tax=Paramecium sonneborni TaxID=65129 RepID=A0A8S1RGE5_9CILI|nr:unnamed protein product [Paramecium sonneborni]
MQVAFSAICVGLDNAGKTSLLRTLSNSQRMEIFPTPTMEIHYVICPKIGKYCLIYDMSGNGRHRQNWRILYQDIQAMIYVIDTSDSEYRFHLQRQLIEEVLNDDLIKKSAIPILFLFNKNDKNNRFNKDDLIKVLGLDSKKFKNKFIFKETSSFEISKLKEAIDNLTDALYSKKQ